jgi:uncharacterized BrkB/YihY/UPF0761 family membrane protein
VKNQKARTMTRFRLIALALMALLTLAVPLPVSSQSCALCYTQAASSGSKMIQALRSGILILIVPPTLGTIGLIFVVHRKRNQVRRIEGSDESGQDW